ncbi:MAG: O-antigen ligase family protein [Bacteroidales bacterium]|nr:O-antigen ligase family protein [Bacteroidales bacterium]
MTYHKFKSVFPESVHHWIFFVLLCILAASMPTSRYVMSLSQILMGVNWLLEGYYREKIIRFSKNKPALIFTSMYALYLIGILWTEDLAMGFGSDLKNKIPMLTLTFIVASSKPFNREQLNWLLLVFSAAVLVTTFIGFSVYLSGDFVNFRHISPYVSHVYLSMMVVITIFLLPWIAHRMSPDKKWFFAALLISLWLLIFLFILRSMTGIFCLVGVLAFLAFRFVFSNHNLILRFIAGAGMLVIISVMVIVPWRMYNKVSEQREYENSEFTQNTSRGNAYLHHTDEILRENGYLVYTFIAKEELREAWNERSEIDYDSRDLPGNELKVTIYRYLSSKGYKKDREALMRLSDEEIKSIERGIPNYLYNEWPGILVRVHQSVWEVYWYTKTRNPSGHTLTQRFELWKGSWQAFREKPIFGWGTGDIFIAVDFGLNKIDSEMENYHMKPHNQYLLLLLMLGLAGTITYFFLYAYFVNITKAYTFLPFNIFLTIMLISMLGNNPIDAQTGQTFFTFFTLFFGIMYRKGF